MRVLEKRLPYKITEGDEKVKLVFYGDVHLGHKLCSKKLFKREVVDRYKDMQNVYLIDMGDCLDLIVAQTNDRRFKASQIDERYLACDNPIDMMIQDYCEMVDPIKDKIICLVDSNHHLSITEKTGTDPTTRIATTLWPSDWESRMLGYSGFLVLRFNYNTAPGSYHRTRTFVISLCHGIGTGGKTEGGFMTTLGNDAVNYIADIHAYGHNHRLQGWDRIKIGPDAQAKKIISTKEIRIATGTYLKGLSDDTSTSYSEKMRFKPNELGHMELNIKFKSQGEEVYWSKRAFL